MMSMYVATATLIAAGLAVLSTAAQYRKARGQEAAPAPLEAKYDEGQMIWSLGEIGRAHV